MADKENDDFQPLKKAKIAKGKKEVLPERFQKPKSDKERRISKGYVLPNTQKNTAGLWQFFGSGG